MLNSPGSLNGLARRYSVPSRELRIALRDNSSPTHENLARAPRLDLADVKSPPVIMPTMTRADRQKTAPWSPLFTSFIEGFALYGASYGCYGALLNACDFFCRVMFYRSKYPAAGGDFSVRATQVHFSRLTRSESRDDGTRT